MEFLNKNTTRRENANVMDLMINFGHISAKREREKNIITIFTNWQQIGIKIWRWFVGILNAKTQRTYTILNLWHATANKMYKECEEVMFANLLFSLNAQTEKQSPCCTTVDMYTYIRWNIRVKMTPCSSPLHTSWTVQCDSRQTCLSRVSSYLFLYYNLFYAVPNWI